MNTKGKEIKTGSAYIDAKLAMEEALNDYDFTVRGKFICGDFVIENLRSKVELINGKLNFKVKRNLLFKNSFQVTFNDSKWLLFSVEDGKAVLRCGNAA